MHIYLDNIRNLLPLLRSRVHTSGIVGTGMQQNHTLLWDSLSLKQQQQQQQGSVLKLECQAYLEMFSILSLPILVSYRDVIKSSLEVKAAGRRVIVSVCFQLHASISEDGCVISPRGLREVHITWSSVETRLWQKTSCEITGQAAIQYFTLSKLSFPSMRAIYQKVGSNAKWASSRDGLDSDALLGRNNRCNDLCKV